MLAATLLTYVENIAFYFYCIYVPYKIVTRGMKLVFNTIFYGALFFLLIALLLDRWEITLEEVSEAIEDVVEDVQEEIDDVIDDIVDDET